MMGEMGCYLIRIFATNFEQPSRINSSIDEFNELLETYRKVKLILCAVCTVYVQMCPE